MTTTKTVTILLTLFLALSGNAFGATAYVSDTTTSNALDPISQDLSHAGAANTVALLLYTCEDNSATNCVPNEATVEGSNATLIDGICENAGGATYNCAYAYRYVNPPTAATTTYLIGTPGNPNEQQLNVVFFSGVDQSTPIDGTAQKTTYTSGTAASLTVTTTASGSMVVDVINHNLQTSTMAPGGSQTEFEDNAGTDHKLAASYRQATTATTYDMTWTAGSAFDRGAHVAFALKAASDAIGHLIMVSE